MECAQTGLQRQWTLVLLSSIERFLTLRSVQYKKLAAKAVAAWMLGMECLWLITFSLEVMYKHVVHVAVNEDWPLTSSGYFIQLCMQRDHC